MVLNGVQSLTVRKGAQVSPWGLERWRWDIWASGKQERKA